MSGADTVVVLDFETTGLSPDAGDRAIEIGAVKICNGRVEGRFQELMHPGQRVSGFIESYTGISNDMLKDARPGSEVMHDFADFIGDFNLVAHNASFDKRFLDAEFARISADYTGRFACSMLAARRICHRAPNHRLGTLVEYLGIPAEGNFHRALFDSEMTTKLWLAMLETLGCQYALPAIPFTLMQKVTRTPRKSVDRLMQRAC